MFPASGVGGPTESDKSSGPRLLRAAAGVGLTLDPNLYVVLSEVDAACKVRA